MGRKCVLIALVHLVFLTCPLHAQSTLNLLRKIKVDDGGATGACDGCQFNRAGDLLAASDNSGYAKLYRVPDGTFVQAVKHSETEVNGPNGEINAIHFSADDRMMLTGMNKTGCKIWDLSTGAVVTNLARGHNTDGAAFSPDGKWVAVARRQVAEVYTLPDYKKVFELRHPTKHECNSIDWSSDSSLLLTGSDGAAVFVTRTADWKQLHQIDFGVDRVKSVRFSPDGKYFAVAGQKLRCRVYDTVSGEMVADLQHDSDAVALPGDDDDGDEPNIEAVEWSSESRYLFSGGSYDGIIRVWRAGDWSLVGWAHGQEYSRQVEYLAVSRDNLVAACGDEGYVYLFQFNPPPEKAPIEQAASPDGIITIEAEDFDAGVPQGGHEWKVIDDTTASGGKKIQALPDLLKSGNGKNENYQTWDPFTDAAKVDYRINFSETGTYYIWTRAKGADVYANSYHAGLNGYPVESADRMENDSREWLWDSRTKDGPRPTLEITEEGPATLNIWMREDGAEIDKILLVRSPEFSPAEKEPRANPRGSPRD